MGIHDGHRKNLRNSFLSVGLEGKTEHQALELLLTYSIPRIDVNPIAHDLINTFGSLAGVIDADVKDLVKVNYISENSAVLIKMIPQIAKLYEKSLLKKKPLIKTLADVRTYMSPFLRYEKNEVVYVLLLDPHLQLIKHIKLSEGSTFSAKLDVRKLIQDVLQYSAKQILLVHNHPSGSAEASRTDVETTHSIEALLGPLEVNLADHIIFAGEDIYSLRAHNELLSSQIQ